MSKLSEKLGITTHRGPDGSVVVRLVGALDAAGAGRLIDEATQIDPGAGDRVMLDLLDVTLLDSAGIGALFYTEAFVHARDGDFTIATPRPPTRTLLERAGLGRCCTPDDDTRRVPAREMTLTDHTHEQAVPR